MPLARHFKAKLLTGLFVLIPVLVSLYAVYLIVTFLDAFVSPILTSVSLSVFGRSLYIPGLGLLLFIIIAYVTGVVTSNYAGKKFLSYGEALLKKIPFVKSVYGSTKDFMEAFSPDKLRSFRGVVMLEFPREGTFCLGLVTGRFTRESVPFCSVFVPTTPNPTSGYVLLLPEDRLSFLPVSVEDAVKYIISLGTSKVNLGWDGKKS
ncbi:MAG TPA: DUF502 domain-containing protein [Syntrophorhabdales bacterium]|nr:DUF502 domain-containing protein [Syntrophorhabdales bacterium]